MSTRSKGFADRLSRARRVEREVDIQRVTVESLEDEGARLREYIASLEAQLSGAIAQRDDALARMAGAHRALDQREGILDGVRRARDDLRAEISRVRRAVVPALVFYADARSYDRDLAPYALADGEVEHDAGARAHDALVEIGIDPPDPLCSACGSRVRGGDDVDDLVCRACRGAEAR